VLLAPPRYAPLPPASAEGGAAAKAKVGEASGAEQSSLRVAADRIRHEALSSTHAYELLRELCDDIGARLSGSKELARALEWAKARLSEAGHQGVAIEPAMVPTWVRGKESLTLLTPEARNIPVLAIGGSVPTPKGGITGELVVVHSETELADRAADIRGKIVLIDKAMPPFDTVTRDPHYGDTVGARVFGASLAAKQGALAVLVRSVTAHSLATLHTGALHYDDNAPKIPAASVTVESAALLSRLSEKHKLTLRLSLESEDRGLTPSGNVVAELRGRAKPEEIVVISGHIDSWDVGQGAVDDGAGVVIAMEALNVLKKLGLEPKRTVRVVLFTNEENGLRGAAAYAEAHKNERHHAAVESDNGAAKVESLGVDTEPNAGEPKAMAELEPVLAELAPLGVTRLSRGHSGADVVPLVKQGALGIGLGHDWSEYFDVHHSDADTLDKVDPGELAQGVAAMAVLAYGLAEQ
jgi:hypothetical protein